MEKQKTGGLIVTGIGRSRSGTAVFNSYFEKIVNTSDEWIISKTGIKSRVFAGEKSNEDLAYEAAEAALADSGIEDIKKIRFCIVCTFTSDRKTPGVAAGVAQRLGLEGDVTVFDINGACSGFVTGCSIADKLLMGKGDCGIVIGSEKISPLLNMEDRNTCVLFGDGAGAVVVEYSENDEFVYDGGCRPSVDTLFCKDGNTGISMNGREVYRFAVETICRNIDNIMKKSGTEDSMIDYYICHQANRRIIESAAEKFTDRKDKFPMNIESRGNTSAASIPLLMAEMNESGCFDDDKQIVITGFGAGLVYAGALLKVKKRRKQVQL